MSAQDAPQGIPGSTAHTTGSPRAVPASVNGWNADYLDAQYAQYQRDPSGLPEDLRQFFQGFDLANARGGVPAARAGEAGESTLLKGLQSLVSAYRDQGHLAAKIDPFGRARKRPPCLEASYHALSAADMQAMIDARAFGLAGTMRAGDLVAHFERAYCGSIGVEYTHIHDRDERAWFRARFEGGAFPMALSKQEKVLALEHLTAAERLDKFLGVRYQGKKRFSLEGGESLIPLLKFFTQRAGELGSEEIIIGMPHRGRVSVLRNYLGKDLGKLFTEFEDSWTEAGSTRTGGDVKYHRGYSGDQALWGQAGGEKGRSVHLSMLNNPSHLESVNGVVMGRCRARQDQTGDTSRRRVISLLMHGDAALPGQGVVAECLNMSQLEGYCVGGTVHVVVNNQVGFTTDQEDSRSTTYCTDIAKFINAPVLHVNADDVDAVIYAARIAAEFRHEFRRDVFIDLQCFRRYGHNEQDEPAYTQPVLTAFVKAHPGTPEVYRRELLASGVISPDQAQEMIDRYTTELDAAQSRTKGQPENPVPPPGKGQWEGMQAAYSFESPKTAVDAKTIREVCEALGRAPEGFHVHPKLKSLLTNRAALPTTKKLSHADAEVIACATLLLDGTHVRLSGQDARRGTFTQRHAVLRDEQSGEKYVPMNNIRGKQAKLDVWDSPLSEYGVVGFEYGYSRAAPRSLVMWEAQFGDFCNTAQVIIDQYMAASEAKWNRWAGLVLLLPHGYEGQGPEHSSARLERFLALCADDNMEVLYPSTGAQLFHALRRQAMRNFRKPLIIMTPKKYLRFEGCSIDELSTGTFQHAIDDAGAIAKDVQSVLYCTGKVYHELVARRAEVGRKDVAIVRVEQLYPFHAKAVRAIDDRYPKGAKRSWVQEEPRNAGAFLYACDAFREQVGVELGYIGRAASASPATASEHAHSDQQDDILTRAVGASKASAQGNGIIDTKQPAKGTSGAKR